MKRLFIIAVVFVTACSGSPKPTPAIASGEGRPTRVTSPSAAAETWVSESLPDDLRAIVGNSPQLERIWRVGDRYRAVYSDGSAAAAQGEGDIVVLTLEQKDASWIVTIAEVDRATLLWPGL